MVNVAENTIGAQTIAQERDSYAGDSVLQNLTMGKGQGFSKVAADWLKQCMTFDQAIDKMVNEQKTIEDIRCGLANWDVIAHNDRIAFRYLPTSREYTPTDHCLNLICSVGRGLSTWAVRSLRGPIGHPTKKNADGEPTTVAGGERGISDFEVLRDYIKIHLFNANRVNQDKSRLFRTWDDGTLRAILSEQYQIINNVWCLETFKDILPGGMVSHWRGNADTIYGNILIPDTIRQENDSDFGGMLSIGNSEIGVRRISSLPSVFRAICQNGCIYDQQFGEGLRKVHRGHIELVSLKANIRQTIESQIPLLPQGIERVLGLRAYGCGDTPLRNLIAQTTIDYKLSKNQATAVFNGWNKELSLLGVNEGRTAYGLLGGITRAGQTFNNDQWVNFDIMGGTLASTDRNGWDKFRNRAGNLTDKQIENHIGELVFA